MKRIIVIGCSGSGKTTLALELGRRLGLPVVHLDKLYWSEGWMPVAGDIFLERLETELAKDEWIIDGSFSSTLERRLSRCDTAIYLRYPRLVCVCGAIWRVLTTYGRVRVDMSAGCPERFDPEFIQYIWQFERKNGARFRELLKESGCTVITLRSRRQARRFLRGLSQPAQSE